MSDAYLADAEKALSDAINALVKLGDRTEPAAAIAAAKELKEADYTAGSCCRLNKSSETAGDNSQDQTQVPETVKVSSIKVAESNYFCGNYSLNVIQSFCYEDYRRDLHE